MSAKKNPSHNQQRDPLKADLAGRDKKRVSRALKKLKSDRTYGQAKQIFEQLNTPILHWARSQGVLTNQWSELLFGWMPPSRNWVQGLGWLAHNFIRYSGQLNSFNHFRQEFGCLFVQGKFEEAEVALNDIEQSFGKSFWLLERRLMLIQVKDGFDAHKSFLSEIYEQSGNPFVNYVAHALSTRCEPHISAEAYQQQINGMLNDVRALQRHELAGTIEFQVSPWTDNWVEFREGILNRLACGTLIDQYLGAIKVAAYSVEAVSDPDVYHLGKILEDMSLAIDDPQIDRLRNLFGFIEAPPIDPATLDLIRAYDKFLTGDNGCVDLAKDLFCRNPLSFDNYWLVSQIQVGMEVDFEWNLPPSSIATELLENIGKVVRNKVSLEIPLELLYNQAFKLGCNHLGITTWQFVQQEKTGVRSGLACRYSSIIGKTSIAGLLCGLGAQPNNSDLNALLKILPESQSLKLLAYQNGLSVNLASDPPIAPPFVRIANARRAELAGDSELVIELLEDLVSGREETVIDRLYQTETASMFFEAQFDLGLYCSAAENVVAIFNRNPNNLRQVQFEELIGIGKNGDFPSLVGSVNWPVLAFLNNGDEQDIYEAVDDFLNSNKFENPLQYIDSICPPYDVALRLLIREVLRPQVIERSPFWSSDLRGQRELRATLLKKLYEVSEEDQEFVVKELSQLDGDRLLEEDYRNVEGPKFVLDFSDINRRMMGYFQTAIDRYNLYRTFEDSGGILQPTQDLLNKLTGEERRDRVKEEKLETSEIILVNAVTGLFNSYLWDSRNGINSTLGTRIRHGSLENQLKRSFEIQGLLASKNMAGEYECSPQLLDRLLSFDEKERSMITESVAQFTEKINQLCSDLISRKLRLNVPPSIVNLIKNEGLPVEEMVDPEGLLDFSSAYSIDKIRAALDLDQITSVATLVAACRRVFDEVALESLHSVRAYFDETVAAVVAEAAASVELVAQHCMSDGNGKAILENVITTARDGFSHDLRTIKNWFSVARNIDQITGSLTKLIEMAARVVNYASNNRLGVLVREGNGDRQVEGLSRVMTHEVLLILFRNIVKHSGISGANGISYRISDAGNDKLLLEVSNRVSTIEKLNDCMSSAQECLEAALDGDILSRGPGKTGLKRVRWLLMQAYGGDVIVSVKSSDHNGAPAFTFSAQF